jgi:hypothetical protein
MTATTAGTEILMRLLDQSLETSGFLPRVRCTHRSFWAHCHVKQGAARPPPIAASLLFLRIPKIKIIYLAAHVKGLFFQLYYRGQRVRYTGCQALYPVVLIGSPTPSTAREWGSPLWIQGGRHTHIRMRGWGGDQFRRWGLHSGTAAPHI